MFRKWHTQQCAENSTETKNSNGFAYSPPKIKKQLNKVQAIKRCSNNTNFEYVFKKLSRKLKYYQRVKFEETFLLKAI